MLIVNARHLAESVSVESFGGFSHLGHCLIALVAASPLGQRNEALRCAQRNVPKLVSQFVI